MSLLSHYFFSIVVLLYLAGCTSKPQVAESTQKHEAPATIRYAQHLTIKYEQNYKVVKVSKAFGNSKRTLTYVLLPKKAKKPSHYSQAQMIRIPVEKMALTTTPPLAYLQWMNAYDLLAAVGKKSHIYDTTLCQLIARKKLPAIGNNKGLNTEVVMNLRPDVLMTGGMPATAFGIYEQLVEAGIPVIVNSSWLETHPLGRLEWVKLMAALTNQEALVNQKFAQTVKEYEQVKQLAAQATTKPKVFKGLLYKNTWYAHGGGSYFARLLADAGAHYHWKDNPRTDLLTLDFEAVYPVGLESKYWLNPGRKIQQRNDLLKQDQRYEAFKAFRQSKIYNNNRRQNAQGGNDYWQSGVVNPQVILKDLVKIFHPELLPDYKMVYYKKID